MSLYRQNDFYLDITVHFQYNNGLYLTQIRKFLVAYSTAYAVFMHKDMPIILASGKNICYHCIKDRIGICINFTCLTSHLYKINVLNNEEFMARRWRIKYTHIGDDIIPLRGRLVHFYACDLLFNVIVSDNLVM